jgi:hypothetical protein
MGRKEGEEKKKATVFIPVSSYSRDRKDSPHCQAKSEESRDTVP